MKITIDKTYTEKHMMERTKEQAKEFKEMYTDNDLLRMFREAIDMENELYNLDIIRCNLSAFPGGSMETDENHYHVEMLCEEYDGFYKLSFYINQSGEIDTRDILMNSRWEKMYTVRKYMEL